MPIYFQDIEDRRIGTGASVVTNADEYPASFPIARWGVQSERYLTYWAAFTGSWLSELMPDDVDEHKDPVLRYPLQINYIKTVCMKHSYVLFGEVSDTPGPLAPVRVSPRRKPGATDVTDADRIKSEELEQFVNRVWMENDGRALQQEQGLTQSFLGGAVFRLSWQPLDKDLEYGIRIEQVLPDFFLPVWDTGRYSRLLEAWIVYRIPTREAAIRFGFDISAGAGDPLYVEHWTEEKVTITLNNKPLRYIVDGEEFFYDDLPNPFGEVPFVYIARERAGSYYGLSLVDDVLEEAKEMNARLADISDVISETAHRETYARNIGISPKTIDLGGERTAVNIGQTPPGGETPDVFAIDPPQVNESMIKHIEYLRTQFGRDVFVPGVADGEDEGSQRSALTLAFRMHPLTSKIRVTRTNWTTGLIQMGKKIARMAIVKKVGGITEAHLKDIDWGVDWSPMIPRDRETDLNEAVLGIQTKMITPKDGNRKLSLTDDPGRTESDVMKWMKFETMLEAAASASGSGGSSSEPGSKAPNGQTKVQTVATVMKEPGES